MDVAAKNLYILLNGLFTHVFNLAAPNFPQKATEIVNFYCKSGMDGQMGTEAYKCQTGVTTLFES